MATTAKPTSLDPRDFLAIDALLDDEEKAIRDTIRQFVRERVLPEVGDWFERGVLPPELAGELAELGLFGMHLEGYGLPGRELRRVRPHVHGARGGRRRRPQPRVGAGLARDVRDLALGHGGAEAAVAAGDARRRRDRVLRADGA